MLRKDGPARVWSRRRDIEPPRRRDHQPDHVIAHCRPAGKLDMQIKVGRGRGYQPGTVRRYGDEPTKSIGSILLTPCSPVKRVSYTVESPA